MKPIDPIEELREEIARLRAEVAELRARVEKLEKNDAEQIHLHRDKPAAKAATPKRR